MNFKKLAIILLITLSFIACKNNVKSAEETEAHLEIKKVEEDTINKTETSSDLYGNYVSTDYHKRDEGYDWVSVIVTDASNNQLTIKVRSRGDKKKPTCSFDAIVTKIDTNTYRTIVYDKGILFEFGQSRINIKPEKKEDQKILYFYCSGGASLAGSYAKINQELDQNQIDKTQFIKILNLQNVGFNVSSIEKDGKNQLTIFTFGLPHEFNETINIENQVVTNAEVEDLNSDGSPELFVFTQNNSDSHRGNVYAFSVNNKQSMSAVYFQPTEENNEINNGYNGQDEFALVETNLIQRFPVFENGIETNKIRQVQYKLEDGEALRKLVVKRQTEYEK